MVLCARIRAQHVRVRYGGNHSMGQTNSSKPAKWTNDDRMLLRDGKPVAFMSRAIAGRITPSELNELVARIANLLNATELTPGRAGHVAVRVHAADGRLRGERTVIEPTYQVIGDGEVFVKAWNELCAELDAPPDWELSSGFYRTNDGGWGLHLRKTTRPIVADIWAHVRSGRPLSAVVQQAVEGLRKVQR